MLFLSKFAVKYIIYILKSLVKTYNTKNINHLYKKNKNIILLTTGKYKNTNVIINTDGRIAQHVNTSNGANIDNDII